MSTEINKQSFRVSLLAFVALVLGGCAELTPVAQHETCQAALVHMGSCGASLPSFDGLSCDATVADQILDMSCDQLGQLHTMEAFYASSEFIPKSRQGGKNGFLCWLGFNFACPEPTCEPDPSLPAPAEDDPCYLYMQYDGCGLCEYYRCRERSAQCGSDEYLEGFVGRYCDRFATVTEPKVSPRAAQWLHDVRQCLVTELEWNTDDSTSCEDIERVGIDSHATCYVDNGFCELGIGDWFAIVHTIDPFDVPFQQVVVTGNACLRTWFGRH